MDKIVIEIPTRQLTNKISVIKAIRILTGLGLKEAKDASEAPGVNTYSCHSSGFEFDEQCRILRSEGIYVGDSVYKLLEELRKLGSEALLQGEDELANEILQLVLTEKLRRRPW